MRPSQAWIFEILELELIACAGPMGAAPQPFSRCGGGGNLFSLGNQAPLPARAHGKINDDQPILIWWTGLYWLYLTMVLEPMIPWSLIIPPWRLRETATSCSYELRWHHESGWSEKWWRLGPWELTPVVSLKWRGSKRYEQNPLKRLHWSACIHMWTRFHSHMYSESCCFIISQPRRTTKMIKG